MISEKSLRRYCSGDVTEIENYAEAIADTQKWEIHHRRELTEDGKFAYYAKDLIKMGEYYKRPAKELIFLTKSDHTSLHNKVREFTAETREKMSKWQKGKPLTDEHRENKRKHKDITVSQYDDPKAYQREYYLKKKYGITK